MTPQRSFKTSTYKRRCTICDERWPETPEFFHRQGNGFAAQCKRCRNARDRERYRINSKARRTEARARYHRARNRALSRLGTLYPDLYEHLFTDELRRDTG